MSSDTERLNEFLPLVGISKCTYNCPVITFNENKKITDTIYFINKHRITSCM